MWLFLLVLHENMKVDVDERVGGLKMKRLKMFAEILLDDHLTSQEE